MTEEQALEIAERVDMLFCNLASDIDPNAVAAEFIARGLSGIFGIEMTTSREQVGVLLKGIADAIGEQLTNMGVG
ncbi:hypothetical protein ACKWRH_25355 [Bradyrhizobium sp. Pa8]|uniref:hypothetical protein n=1 Tax=Bradyrhizobium sp. Pa8 TaxID=3386552 RepID=UPI00403F6B6D